MSTQRIRTIYNKLFNDVALTPQEWKIVGHYLNTITPSGVPIINEFNPLAQLRRFLFLRKFSPEFVYENQNQATALIARIMSKANKDKNNDIYKKSKSMLPDFYEYQIEKIHNRDVSRELTKAFTQDEIFIDEIDLRDKIKIAEGSFGSVSITRSASYFTNLDKHLVVKQPKDHNDNIERANILNEIRSLSHFKDADNIVQIIGISIGDTIGIVLEYMNARSLSVFYENNYLALTDIDKRNIAFQTVNGVNEIHRLGWLHRDLKFDNTLININEDGSLTVKISDTATAVNKMVYSEIGIETVTTWAYCDHRLLFDSARSYTDAQKREFIYSTQTEVFCLGPILYMIFTGEVSAALAAHIDLLNKESKRVKPVDEDPIIAAHQHEVEMITTLANNHPAYCEADKIVLMQAPIPNSYRQIIAQCYRENRENRPKTDEILDVLEAPIPKPLTRINRFEIS